MAIQMRRGIYDKFDPTRLVAGEWAVVLSNDPVAKDGRAAYVCFASGIVKRIATHEDMEDEFLQIRDETVEWIRDESCAEVLQQCDELIDALDALIQQVASNEVVRVTAEQERILTETERDGAEQQREANEQARQELAEDMQSKLDDGYFDGATYTPDIDEDGILSWSNDKGKSNPPSVNVRGPKGNDGVVTTLDSGMYMFEIVETDLTLVYDEDADVPNVEIDEDGCLYLTIEGD